MVPSAAIDPTGQRISVQAPSPPTYPNSMSPGLRQEAIAVPAAVYPVGVHVNATGAGPLARAARTPFTYSCRVFSPAGAGADQMLRAASDLTQPVTGTAPDRTGRAPLAAVHTTLWPPVPESRAPSASGAVSRYTPSASSTRTSPVMAPSTARTSACALVSVRTGVDAEPPELASSPVGDTKIVVWVAADATGATRTATP